MISMSRRVRDSETIRMLSVVNGKGHGHNAMANSICQYQPLQIYDANAVHNTSSNMRRRISWLVFTIV